MLRQLSFRSSGVDWLAFGAAVLLSLLGLLTMSSFSEGDPFALRQAAWLLLGIIAFFATSSVDWRILKRGSIAGIIYIVALVPLIVLIVAGEVTQGARSWFDIGPFALQPVEFVKLALIIALAKYFSRRHIEIRNIRHILVSGLYALFVFALVAAQPDFGSALIIGSIWLGMVLISGISRLQLAAVVFLRARCSRRALDVWV
jgi:rod shape determining protein RodA